MTNLSPKPKIVVTGCLVERCPEKINRIAGVDAVLTMAAKEQFISGSEVWTERSRPFLKIQEGCPNSCSFCSASRIRGKPRSKAIEDVTLEIESLRDRGYGEIVLVGLNVGAYGADVGSSLVRLLRELRTIQDLPRIRLSSLEPDAITAELLRLWDELPLCRHLHIPLQSGSDRVLKAMARNYSSAEYAERITTIARSIPAIALGTDVIVGFPAEDEGAFLETKHLLERLPFAYFHVFSYSPRPGTPAYDLGDPIPKAEKRRRSQILRELGSKKSLEYRQRFLGQVLPVVVEGHNRALTDNYIRVELGHRDHPKSAQALVHPLRPVVINVVEASLTFGETLKSSRF
jgi:threonylcarbamoyladenosine tRNA methylthiotransferase MtaB